MATAVDQDVLAQFDPAEAAAEALRRRRARRNLIPFAEYMMPTYRANWHHRGLAGKLEAVERGEITRLIIQMPPQHGKSTLASVYGPNFFLGRHADWPIVVTGYGDDIASYHSRRARDAYVTRKYGKVFPYRSRVRHGRVLQDRRRPYVHTPRHSIHEWETGEGGSYYAVGIGGALTGRPMKIGIIDDPHKNRAEAESKAKREAVWQWYESTFYTRQAPNAAIIVIMTPWHPDDLGGRLLKKEKEGKGDHWDVVNYPAISEDYEALWPERYDAAALARIRAALSEREWNSLYMLKRSIRGGNLFKVDSIVYHADPAAFPAGPYVRFWDVASTKKQRASDDPDFTMGGLMAMTFEGPFVHFWLLDLVYMQEEAPKRDRKIRQVAKEDGAAVRIGIEAVGGYKDVAANMAAALGGLRAVEAVNVANDKVTRAEPLEAIIEHGRFHVLRAPWNDIFYEQMSQFPSSNVHDDAIDVVSGGYHMLAAIHGVEGKEEPVFNAYSRYGGLIPEVGEFW